MTDTDTGVRCGGTGRVCDCPYRGSLHYQSRCPGCPDCRPTEGKRCGCEWESPVDGEVDARWPAELDPRCPVHGAPNDFGGDAQPSPTDTGDGVLSREEFSNNLWDAMYGDFGAVASAASGDRIRAHDTALRARLAATEARIAEVAAIVDEQACDEGLWFSIATAPEAYLQAALRRLHEAVEEKTQAECVAALTGEGENDG